jgi:hypothetical protein
MLPARAVALLGIFAAVGCADRAIIGEDAQADTTSDTEADGGRREPADDEGDAPLPSCNASTPASLTRCVDAAALEGDIRFIADIRTPGSTHWLAVQEMCADRLTMLGYEVQLQEYGTGTNVLGYRRGTVRPDEIVMIGAHYDHIPDCLGADDNASGVGGALEVARVLADVRVERTLGVACWDQEELGLIGSTAFVGSEPPPGQSIAAYFNYDMIGIRRTDPGSQQVPAGLDLVFPEEAAALAANEFRGDFIVVVANEAAYGAAASFRSHADERGLSNVVLDLPPGLENSPAVSDLRRSDHAPFWLAGLPAVFLSDTGNLRHPNYHCIGAPDTADALDYEFAAEVVAATVGAVAESLVLVP